MEPIRKFKIIINSKECGTCSGPTPSAVAKKVVKKLCEKSNKMVKFSLKECKRGCKRVCGPYQGRMEKLDKLCKRDGKTITHRVVCGKVRKMRGGEDADLFIHRFKKNDDDPPVKFTKIDLKPCVFFFPTLPKTRGGISWYRCLIANNEIIGINKTVSIFGYKFTKSKLMRHQNAEKMNSLTSNNVNKLTSNNVNKFTKRFILRDIFETNTDATLLPRKIASFLYYAIKFEDESYDEIVEKFQIALRETLLEINKKYPNSYKTIRKYLRILINATSNILNTDTSLFREMREIKVEELNIYHFTLPCPLRNYFEIKYIGQIPYLFLYSNELSSVTKNIKNSNEYKRKFKFAISNNCNIFMYENGEITLLNMNYVELEENGLFKLLVQDSTFRNEQDVSKSSGKIIDIIKKVYPDLKDIISCLEKLHLMYERNKLNK